MVDISSVNSLFTRFYLESRDRETRLSALEKSISDKSEELGELREEVALLEKVHTVLLQLADARTKSTIGVLESLVSRALRLVFDKNYQFKIETKQLKKRTDMQFLIVDENGGVGDLVDDHGLGLSDVTAVVLNMFVLSAMKGMRKVLVLDEPCRDLHGTIYREKAAQLMSDLQVATGIQLIVTTQSSEYLEIATVAYEFKHVGDHTEVERL